MLKPKHPRGQRGLLEADLVEDALSEIERSGLEGFSLRSVARVIGCDAATLIYRFGSKEGLERAVTDRLHSEISPPAATLSWQKRISNMARQYRALAQRYPAAFPLLMRFWTSGPRDLIIAEQWHRALADSGIQEKKIPAAACASYAAILGLCMSEIGGLLSIPTEASIAEIVEQEELEVTKRLLPIFETLDAEEVFETALNILICGLETSLQKSRNRSPRT